MPTTCPNPDRLLQALSGTLLAAELDQLAAHVETCALCQDTVASLPADPLSRLLRETSLDLTPVPELIERVLQLATASEPRTTSIHDPAVETAAPRGVAPAAPVPFLEPPQQPDEIGRLGPYRVLATLGEGGMGMVFRAEDPRLQRLVALKVMKPELAARPQARERFLREARAMAKVEHPCIVPVYQADEVMVNGAAVPYLAMPLLKGESLADRLRRPELLPLPEVARIGREAAEGLAAAHAAGLIHRDIKPGNLWLEKHGEPGASATGVHVKLLDFGLARAGDPDGDLSASGALLGTPAYMAPEQAESSKVDARADLFSLGCVLYELTTGRRPFTGATMWSILQQVATHQPPAPQSINGQAPPALSGLIEQLMAKDPDARPASAQEVAARLAELEKTIASGEASLPATRVLNPFRKRSWRWFPWAILSAGVAAAVLVAVVVMDWLPTGPIGSPTEQTPTIAQPITALAPLKGDIDVRLFGKDAEGKDDPGRRGLWLDDPAALPLRPGDEISIEANLNRPAFVYVLWIDTEGQVLPVYPWRPGHWEDRPAEEQKVKWLRRPEALNRYYPIEMGTPGMETLVLLARETPLSRDVDLRAVLGVLPPQKGHGQQATAWFENGRLTKNHRGWRGRFDETQRDDPVLTAQELIRAKLLGKHFEYVLAVSFANRGK